MTDTYLAAHTYGIGCPVAIFTSRAESDEFERLAKALAEQHGADTVKAFPYACTLGLRGPSAMQDALEQAQSVWHSHARTNGYPFEPADVAEFLIKEGAKA